MKKTATKKNDSLYPEVIFHFTKKKGNLLKILNSYFKPSWARENVTHKDDKPINSFAVPIVSFCDLKLSEIKSHTSKYGTYGIGLTKEWATRNGITPVMYINKESDLFKNFDNAIKTIFQQIEDSENIENNLRMSFDSFMNFYRYTKNYEGILKRKGEDEDKPYRFADEREWRYAIPFNTPGINTILPYNAVDTPEKKLTENEKIKHLKLKFEPLDI